MNPDEKIIREKAHELWLASGKAEGRHLEHWEQAKAAAERHGHDDDEIPAAGPHAKPELTNPDATPGSGMFPEPGDDDAADAPPSG